MNALERLQAFFRELFLLDLADLDFGIYRLYHLKQEEIERFITEQLPREVDVAFASVSDEEKQAIQREIAELQAEIRDQINDDAILPDGSINPEYREIKAKFARELIQRYEEVRGKQSAFQNVEGHKIEVFNHLVNFFSRYYEDGDFIPKRRYGAREAYAVPYNGEEVFFHWANRDQHYVKTAEQFKDYAFKVSNLTGSYRVRFIITEASVPRDNTKGKHRYFFPRPDLAEYNPETHEFVLPFEYRLPTPEEAELYGGNAKAQQAILEEALTTILEAVPDKGLKRLLDNKKGEENQSVLMRRMRHFCRRNTSDYFVHKDLRGFLQRELEFYIKDQIIHVMDIEGDLDAKRRIIRVFRRLASQVIDFLATVEDVQKTLFEKKKFVLETDYLIPIQHVPRAFWPEILANQGQLDEWERWGMLNPAADLMNQAGEVNDAFLEKHPTLPVHTQHFSPEFTRRLLEALPFEDLDEATDGVLVHSENYQALGLLQTRYWEQVKCIYIDPPYNTGEDGFVYKDHYQSSSWLSMMRDRLLLSSRYLNERGALFVSCDFHEQSNLAHLELTGDLRHFATFHIKVRHEGRILKGDKEVQEVMEYVIGYKRHMFEIAKIPLERRPEEYRYVIKETASPAQEFFIDGKKVSLFHKGQYELVEVEPGKGILKSISIRGTIRQGNSSGRFFVAYIEGKFPKGSLLKVEGIGDDGLGYRYFLVPEKARNGIYFQGRPLTRTERYKPYPTLFDFVDQFNSVGYEGDVNFKNGKKPVAFIAHWLKIGNFGINDQMMDFFAGSGSSGHAVINLNREDGGQRRFILVEMGEYFDTVLVPRIAKVMFTPEWRHGKPRRLATVEEAQRTPRIVKIIRLESYDDALHNIAAPTALERAAAQEKPIKDLEGEDAFRLKYWITLPLEQSETMLRALNLRRPFDYSLEILTDDGPQRKPVDLVETFNYLYGLRVRRYETWRNPEDESREYRVVKARDREGRRRILVIWRDMDGLDAEKDRAFLERKIREMEDAGETWDEILINGDTPTPGIASLDPLFKELMMTSETA